MSDGKRFRPVGRQSRPSFPSGGDILPRLAASGHRNQWKGAQAALCCSRARCHPIGLVQTAISVIGDSVPNNANILHGVVTGMGFIGAGAIIRQGDFTTGHATAAGIWTVGIMGAAVGYGYYDIGIILTAANLIILMLRYLTATNGPAKVIVHPTARFSRAVIDDECPDGLFWPGQGISSVKKNSRLGPITIHPRPNSPCACHHPALSHSK
jgi:putative Mg2+ transporter-C (MgtC) family protein